MAIDFAIKHRKEAIAYLNHPILGKRLEQTTQLLLTLETDRITEVMDYPDDLKLQSSMTLFDAVSPTQNSFEKVLSKFYSGAKDLKTLKLLTE